MAQHGVQIFHEPTSCTCEQRTYTKDNIQAAAAKALSLASEKRTIGEDKYPHAYNDYEHFKFEHAEMPYLEYPIENKNRLYEGSGKPGPDHVVIGSIAEDYRSAVFCAVITHDGQKHSGFTEGHGDASKPHAGGQHEVHERVEREHDGRKREEGEHEGHGNETHEREEHEHEVRKHEEGDHEPREHEVHEEKNPGNKKLVKHIELH